MERPWRRRKGRDGEHRGRHLSDAGPEGNLRRFLLSSPFDVVPAPNRSVPELRRGGAADSRRRRKGRREERVQPAGANNEKCRDGYVGTRASLMEPPAETRG